MSNLQLKICGMKIPENISAVSALAPDYMGFIFYENSPRNFEGNIPDLPGNIKKTGVFVNATAEFILEKQQKYNFQAIQLHGEESPEFTEQLRSLLDQNQASGTEIIKVFSVKDSFDFDHLKPYEGKVEYFLFDSKGPNKGGNGICFNWEVLKDYPSETPFFLSGGIGLREAVTVEEFRRHLKSIGKEHMLYALDVNSRFETVPGIKNLADLKEFQKNLEFKNTVR